MSDVAIAELTIRYGLNPDLAALRAGYPELAFLFNHVEDAHAEYEQELSDLARAKGNEIEELAREVSTLEDRNVQLRQAALQVASIAMMLPGLSSLDARAHTDVIAAIIREDVV